MTPEFEEPGFFERQEEMERKARNAAREAELEQLEEIDLAKAADRMAEHGRKLRAFSLSVIQREYAALGLQPPPGMVVSLHLLLSMGWTIGELMGRRTLIRPPAAAPPARDWVRDGSS